MAPGAGRGWGAEPGGQGALEAGAVQDGPEGRDDQLEAQVRESGGPGVIVTRPGPMQGQGVAPVAVVEIAGVGGGQQHRRPEGVGGEQDPATDVEDRPRPHRRRRRVEEGQPAGVAGPGGQGAEGDGPPAAVEGDAHVGGDAGPSRQHPVDVTGRRPERRRPRSPPGAGDDQDASIPAEEQRVDGDEEGIGAVAVETGQEHHAGRQLDGFATGRRGRWPCHHPERRPCTAA